MLSFILIGIVAMFVLWFLFANAMTWKKNADKIPTWLKYPLYVIVTIGYILDVLFNWIYATVIFLQWPRQLTLSERLRKLLIAEEPESWRWKTAYFMCHYMIEPWDYNHCGLMGK